MQCAVGGSTTRRFFLVCVTLWALPVAASAQGNPVVVLIHGRDQDPTAREAVRAEFVGALVDGQRALWGREVIPRDHIAFVWYGDLIGSGAPVVASPGCVGLQQDNQASAADLDSADPTDPFRARLIGLLTAVGVEAQVLRTFTRDTYRYFSSMRIRCEADARLESQLRQQNFRQRPLIIAAHSMGGIVSLSSLVSNAQAIGGRLRVPQYITMGTQVGVEPIYQAMFGTMVRPPIPVPNTITRWTNFRNSGDLLSFPVESVYTSTVPERRPVDVTINQSGERHASRSYLTNPTVVRAIVGSWCRAHSGPAPTCNGLGL